MAPDPLNIASLFTVTPEEAFNVVEDLEPGTRESWRAYASKPNQQIW